MIKVLVHGSNGKMGGHVMAEIAKSDDLELFCTEVDYSYVISFLV